MSSSSASNVPETGGSPKHGATISAGAAIARAAALGTVRRDSPDEIREAATMLRDLGDLVTDSLLEEEENDTDDTTDAIESDIADEDEPTLPGWDDAPADVPDCQSLHGEREADDFDVPRGFRLLVDDEVAQCVVETPTWIKWRAATPFGRDWLNNLERRLKVLRTIAAWLTKERQAFLKNPEPWYLGSGAYKEMEANWCSVSQGDLVENLKLTDLGEKSIVQSAMTKAILEWPDGSSFSLDFIFGSEARMAWTANAVLGLAKMTDREMEDVLERHRKTSIPKGKKKAMASKPLSKCDFTQTIQKANAMAGTAWADVIRRYKPEMLEQDAI